MTTTAKKYATVEDAFQALHVGEKVPAIDERWSEANAPKWESALAEYHTETEKYYEQHPLAAYEDQQAHRERVQVDDKQAYLRAVKGSLLSSFQVDFSHFVEDIKRKKYCDKHLPFFATGGNFNPVNTRKKAMETSIEVVDKAITALKYCIAQSSPDPVEQKKMVIDLCELGLLVFEMKRVLKMCNFVENDLCFK